MNKKQKAILIGMVLGDAYLQKTGKKNARIRLEHSEKQKEYLLWKGKQFFQYFQGKPKKLERFNPVYKKTYQYFRWQSNTSPEIGKFRNLFYLNNRKIIPKNLPMFLTEPLSLAIWFMDDGYFYRRDRMAYIYLPKYSDQELKILLTALKENFTLEGKIKKKKGGNLVLVFGVDETEKLISLLKPHIFPSMLYKIESDSIKSLDPLSTAADNAKIRQLADQTPSPDLTSG